MLDSFLQIQWEYLYNNLEWTLWEQRFSRGWRNKLCLKMQIAKLISSILLIAKKTTEKVQISVSFCKVRSYSTDILNE